MDGLFASDQRRKMESERLYVVILRRVHALVRHINSLNRRLTAAQYAIPRVLQSATRYVWKECLAFVANQLVEDGFHVQVTRQNILVLSWAHWIPADERDAFLRSTGSRIDGHGNIVAVTQTVETREYAEVEAAAAAAPNGRSKVKAASALKFRPQTTSSGGGVYPEDLLDLTF